MREYRQSEEKEISKIFCNCCGKELKVKESIVMQGCFHCDYEWGYFSKKDGMHHSFDLCEECYDKLTADFVIPVTESETKELL